MHEQYNYFGGCYSNSSPGFIPVYIIPWPSVPGCHSYSGSSGTLLGRRSNSTVLGLSCDIVFLYQHTYDSPGTDRFTVTSWDTL